MVPSVTLLPSSSSTEYVPAMVRAESPPFAMDTTPDDRLTEYVLPDTRDAPVTVPSCGVADVIVKLTESRSENAVSESLIALAKSSTNGCGWVAVVEIAAATGDALAVAAFAVIVMVPSSTMLPWSSVTLYVPVMVRSESSAFAIDTTPSSLSLSRVKRLDVVASSVAPVISPNIGSAGSVMVNVTEARSANGVSGSSIALAKSSTNGCGWVDTVVMADAAGGSESVVTAAVSVMAPVTVLAGVALSVTVYVPTISRAELSEFVILTSPPEGMSTRNVPALAASSAAPDAMTSCGSAGDVNVKDMEARSANGVSRSSIAPAKSTTKGCGWVAVTAMSAAVGGWDVERTSAASVMVPVACSSASSVTVYDTVMSLSDSAAFAIVTTPVALSSSMVYTGGVAVSAVAPVISPSIGSAGSVTVNVMDARLPNAVSGSFMRESKSMTNGSGWVEVIVVSSATGACGISGVRAVSVMATGSAALSWSSRTTYVPVITLLVGSVFSSMTLPVLSVTL